jgi:hypothetical protein
MRWLPSRANQVSTGLRGHRAGRTVTSHNPVGLDRLLIKPTGGGQVDTSTSADSSPEGNQSASLLGSHAAAPATNPDSDPLGPQAHTLTEAA